jgi:molybdopterin-guanine dinucleotide biosynthesis protein A
VVRDREEVTGVLLVGGGSTRFGSPKALAAFEGRTLGERAYSVLREAFERVMAVGKEGDALPLPFPVFDDGSDERATIVGVAASLRLAETDLCVVLPTDMPFVSAQLLRSLGEAAAGVDAAVVQTGPLPGAYRRTALPVLERRIAAGKLGLRDALAELDHRIVEASTEELKNVNTVEDLPAGS